MRVAVVSVTGGGFSGGYTKYLHEIVPRLASQASVADVAAFVEPALQNLLPASLVRPWSYRDAERGIEWLRVALRDFRADVVLIPTARWMDTGIPTACMVQNMEPFVRPLLGNPPSEAAKNIARLGAAFIAVRRSARLIAVSEFVRHNLIRVLRAAPAKIGVVPVGTSRLAPQEPAGAEGWSRFAFTAGSIRPARGLEDVVGAFARSSAARAALNLVVAGGSSGHDPRYRQHITRMAARHSVPLIWAGALTPSQMAWAYNRCFSFVMTSRVEACPNVVLEALVYGAPSISTDSPPMPEFFGEAALYYPAGDAESLASRVDLLLTNDSTRSTLSRAALLRAPNYSWEATAEATVRELAIAARER